MRRGAHPRGRCRCRTRCRHRPSPGRRSRAARRRARCRRPLRAPRSRRARTRRVHRACRASRLPGTPPRVSRTRSSSRAVTSAGSGAAFGSVPAASITGANTGSRTTVSAPARRLLGGEPALQQLGEQSVAAGHVDERRAAACTRSGWRRSRDHMPSASLGRACRSTVARARRHLGRPLVQHAVMAVVPSGPMPQTSCTGVLPFRREHDAGVAVPRVGPAEHGRVVDQRAPAAGTASARRPRRVCPTPSHPSATRASRPSGRCGGRPSPPETRTPHRRPAGCSTAHRPRAPAPSPDQHVECRRTEHVGRLEVELQGLGQALGLDLIERLTTRAGSGRPPVGRLVGVRHRLHVCALHAHRVALGQHVQRFAAVRRRLRRLVELLQVVVLVLQRVREFVCDGAPGRRVVDVATLHRDLLRLRVVVRGGTRRVERFGLSAHVSTSGPMSPKARIVAWSRASSRLSSFVGLVAHDLLLERGVLEGIQRQPDGRTPGRAATRPGPRSAGSEGPTPSARWSWSWWRSRSWSSTSSPMPLVR